MPIGVNLTRNFFKTSFPASGWKCSSIGLLLQVLRLRLNEGHSQSETGNETRAYYCPRILDFELT
ncbi:hypothetical protein GXM_03538 [Nostoc sphaeroides CCNUC1]|uniref:Uncharacterized protein n=1 Tax=Nostoc sphaeroides CCNUC1 TaxID=2653204 RepID=A0A5P8W027_9NOSO|nr:hypothetical protein GXM_03538 [Nostoc sphaeroides CCNUC1]